MIKKFFMASLACAICFSFSYTSLAEGYKVGAYSESIESPSSILEETITLPLFLGERENQLVKDGALLFPGREYLFPILEKSGDNFKKLKKSSLEGYKLRLKAQRENPYASSVSLEIIDGYYFLKLKLTPSIEAKATDILISLSVSEENSFDVFLEKEFSLRAGYEEISKDALSQAEKGKEIKLSKGQTIITEEMFEDLGKKSKGEAITLAGDNFSLTLRPTGEKLQNLISSSLPIKNIVDSFKDNSFEFISFPAGNAFSSMATLSIDCSSLALDEGKEPFAYNYYNGRLRRIYGKFDEDNMSFSFKTKYLGAFLLTDKEIKNGSLVSSSVLGASSFLPSSNKVVSTGSI